VLRAFQDVDLILHAGDLVRPHVLEMLEKMAPVEAVLGNVDDFALRMVLPRQKVITAHGFRIGIIHGDGPGPSTLARARAAFSQYTGDEAVNCVVFGHTHQPYCEAQDGVLYLNPGSPTDCRRAPRPSCAVLHLDGVVRGEIVWL
jgi:putative phosphoesterase